MKIGDRVKIKECDTMPEVVGEHAEILDMQIQEFEKYTVYPLWVKMLSGERKDSIYGFTYDEVEVLPEASGKDIAKTKLAEQLEEVLRGVASVEDIAEVERIIKEEEKGMKIGEIVKVKNCDSMPEVAGESAEIVDMQIQEFEKYTVYPLWVKVLSGGRKGSIYGFKYNEVEVLPKVDAAGEAKSKERTELKAGARTKLAEQLEEVVRGVTSVEDIAEIERVISEVKGKILAEPTLGFWEDKTPCWEMFRCPEAMRKECPAFKYRTLPCWQIEGTYCKLLDYGQKGNGTDICRVCRVYKRWGHGEPIEIKLHGKGFNSVTESVLK